MEKLTSVGDKLDISLVNDILRAVAPLLTRKGRLLQENNHTADLGLAYFMVAREEGSSTLPAATLRGMTAAIKRGVRHHDDVMHRATEQRKTQVDAELAAVRTQYEELANKNSAEANKMRSKLEAQKRELEQEQQMWIQKAKELDERERKLAEQVRLFEEQRNSWKAQLASEKAARDEDSKLLVSQVY